MASYDLLNINTSVYSTAAGRGQAAAKAIESAIDELLAAMRAATSSAGHGAGADFAAKYEPGVSLLLQETANLIGSLYTISGMFTDTGNWHDELEKFNATGKPFTPPSRTPTAVVMIPQPGSIQGGTGQKPNGWSFIEKFVTEVWPDADTGKLVNLASAFGAFGDAVSAARQAQLADTMSSFDTYVSSEVSAATAYVDELSDNMNALANHAHDLRDSVNEFVKYVSHSTSEVIETLEEMLFTLGGGLVLSALLAPETGGASLGGDGLASAGEVASAASRVNTILQELRGLQFFKYASGGWEALNDLDKTAESTSIVRTLAGKVGVGLVKGGYKGAYVYGPVASIATLAITSDPREAVTTEIASVAGGLGGGVLEGFGDGGSDLLGTAAKKASAAAGSATTGAEELGSNDAVPVGTGVPSTKGGAPVAPAGRTLAPSDRGVLGKFLTPGGKVGGAVAGTLIELKIENKLTGQDFAMDFSEDLLRNSVEKDKVLVVVPKVAAVG